MARTKDRGDTAEDGEQGGGGGERGEGEGEDKEDEEDEEEDEGEKMPKKEKKRRAGCVEEPAGGSGRAAAVKEPPGTTPASTAKEKDRAAGSWGSSDATAPPVGVEDQATVTSATLVVVATAPERNAGAETADYSLPDVRPLATRGPGPARNRSHWPFSIHTGRKPAAPPFHVHFNVILDIRERNPGPHSRPETTHWEPTDRWRLL